MRASSHQDIHAVRTSVERVRRLSDRIIGIGPFKLGLDGISAWIPVVGLLYSAGAGGFLLHQAVKARAAPGVIARMAAFVLADALTDMIPLPIAPAITDMLFTGHKWAADALTKHMDETVYYEGTREEAEADPEFRRHRADQAGRRVVYLR